MFPPTGGFVSAAGPTGARAAVYVAGTQDRQVLAVPGGRAHGPPLHDHGEARPHLARGRQAQTHCAAG